MENETSQNIFFDIIINNIIINYSGSAFDFQEVRMAIYTRALEPKGKVYGLLTSTIDQKYALLKYYYWMRNNIMDEIENNADT